MLVPWRQVKEVRICRLRATLSKHSPGGAILRFDRSAFQPVGLEARALVTFFMSEMFEMYEMVCPN